MNKILLSVALLLAAAPRAFSAAITAGQNITSASAGALQPAGDGNYSGNLVNEAGLAYSNTFLLDMAQYNAREVSVQAIFSSVTFASPTVTDGQKSTGSFTVIAYTALSSATATDNLTVVNNSFTALPTITVGNCVLKMGQDFLKGSSAHNTAVNLAAAITACDSRINTIASASVVYATATYGSYANGIAFVSDNSSVTVAAALMSGGADNASVSINGVSLKSNTDWAAVTSSATTAANIVTAINANTSLNSVVIATSDINVGADYGVVTVTSIKNGSVYNYAMTTSSPTALSVLHPTMIGGADSGFTLGSQKIVATAAHGLTLGLPVLYAIGSNPALAGLTTGTTYYAVPYSATGFYLARCSSCAVSQLGGANYATVTSTTSGTAAHTYTIAPLGWEGSTGSYIWQTSNDNSNWSTAPSTGTVSVSSNTAATVLSTNWGVLGYRYLRLKYTSQTSGGLALQVPVYLKKD